MAGLSDEQRVLLFRRRRSLIQSQLFSHNRQLSLPKFSILLFLFIASFKLVNGQEIADNQQLFVNSITITGNEFFSENDLLEEIQTQQNSTWLFGLVKPGLWSYYFFDFILWDSSVQEYLKNNLGDPPKPFSSSAFNDDISYLSLFYKYYGFFNVTIDTSITRQGDWVDLRINIQEKSRAKINEVTYNFNLTYDSDLPTTILEDRLVKKTDGYSVFAIRNERDRILTKILNTGHAFTTQDSIRILADTTHYPNIDLTYNISPGLPTIVDRQSMYIYTTRSAVDSSLADTVSEDIYQIYSTDVEELSPSILKRYNDLVYLERFSPERRINTIRNMSELGVFRSINITIDSVYYNSSNNSQYLFPRHEFKMGPKHEIRPEIRLDTKNEGSIGADMLYSNKNLFGSAENFKTSIGGALQLAYIFSGGQEQSNVWSIDGGMNFTFPYFFGTRNKSFISLNAQRASRVAISDTTNQRYGLTIIGGGLSLQWIHTTLLRSKIDLIELNWVDANQTYFNEQGLQNQEPYVNSVIRWSLQYFNTDFIDRSQGSIFDLVVEESGLIPRILSNESRPAAAPTGQILGLNYFQYLKIYTDLRWYQRNSSSEVLGIKLFGGIIFPYGISIDTPPLNRFFGGGISGLRAWAPTTLGPGSAKSSSFGYYDIKIEGAFEYRKKWNTTWGYVAFIDWGNLWYRKGLPGSFVLNQFYKEIAVGYGLGLRNFLLPIGPIRLDFAWKAYDPAANEGDKYKLGKINLDRLLRQVTILVGIGHSF